MKRLALFALGACICSSVMAASLPDRNQRRVIFQQLSRTLSELDGEALIVRENRPVSWDETVQALRAETDSAESPFQVLRLFYRLDQAFTNLHSHFIPGPDLRAGLPAPVRPRVPFRTEWLTETRTRFVIAAPPYLGDELIAINGRSMESWSAEHFNFCKFALREQCDRILPFVFFRELLSWERSQGLVYTIRRGERVWDVEAPLDEGGPIESGYPRTLPCGAEGDRYPGFKRVYEGGRACVYQSDSDPKTAILRITSFAYFDLPASDPIQHPAQEIERLLPWWRKHAVWDHLVIDVIDNTGGYAPIPYYQLLFQKPFQEQHMRLRKNRLLADPALRAEVFWGSGGQELWFQDIVSSGVWERTRDDEFLPPVPMFCVDETKNCAEGAYTPFPHTFRGRISLLVNPFCISSCDGFAFTLKENLGERVRVIGQPHAADTSYARMVIDVYMAPAKASGVRLELKGPRAPQDPKALFRQAFVVSRSTDSKGVTVSGKPLPLDRFVPITLQNAASWHFEAVRAAVGP